MVTLAFGACSDNHDDYSPAGQVSSDCVGLYFAASSGEIEVVPTAAATGEISVYRMDSTQAATYKLVVLQNQDDVFTVPSTVSFAAGEKEAVIPVDFSKANVDVTYDLQLTFEDANINPYQTYHVYTYSASRVKWDAIGTGYWLDGNINTFFGVETLPLIVNIEKNAPVEGSYIRYRFNSPFAYVATMMDENGGYDGYPYNEEGDCDQLEHKFVITVTTEDNKASLAPVDLGMDYGYGMFSVGTVYGYMSQSSSYPLGTYSEADGVITFPKKSLYVSMANYGTSVAANVSKLYLSKEAYAKTLQSATTE